MKKISIIFTEKNFRYNSYEPSYVMNIKHIEYTKNMYIRKIY